MMLLSVLLILLVLISLWAVMTPLLLRAAIGLAATSALLTMIMYQLGAPLAAVFELSVCAGLISVVFVSVVSLTHRLPLKEFMKRRQSRIKRFIFLPLLLVAALAIMLTIKLPFQLQLPAADKISDVRVMLWNIRRIDLFGQIMALLAGVYGVLILFRGRKTDGD
ncbi:MAG: hypothetical protein PHH14_04355 [Candidatus Margulisbacteria bacterium]|nr:hypothetical protein [Candidatus Margulisiibacteriota bacterium]